MSNKRESMRSILIKLCWPILRIFEQGQGTYHYKPSHRIILLVIGVLFSVLGSASLAIGVGAATLGALVPVVVFFSVSLVCLIVAGLGSERAVAKIWGSK